jgi:hypothetical protein
LFYSVEWCKPSGSHYPDQSQKRDHWISEFGVLDIQKQTTDCWPGACGIQIILQNSASKNTKKVLPQDGALFIKNINILSLIHKPMQ